MTDQAKLNQSTSGQLNCQRVIFESVPNGESSYWHKWLAMEEAKPSKLAESVEILASEARAVALERISQQQENDRIWDMLVLAARSSRE